MQNLQYYRVTAVLVRLLKVLIVSYENSWPLNLFENTGGAGKYWSCP